MDFPLLRPHQHTQGATSAAAVNHGPPAILQASADSDVPSRRREATPVTRISLRAIVDGEAAAAPKYTPHRRAPPPPPTPSPPPADVHNRSSIARQRGDDNNDNDDHQGDADRCPWAQVHNLHIEWINEVRRRRQMAIGGTTYCRNRVSTEATLEDLSRHHNHCCISATRSVSSQSQRHQTRDIDIGASVVASASVTHEEEEDVFVGAHQELRRDEEIASSSAPTTERGHRSLSRTHRAEEEDVGVHRAAPTHDEQSEDEPYYAPALRPHINHPILNISHENRVDAVPRKKKPGDDFARAHAEAPTGATQSFAEIDVSALTPLQPSGTKKPVSSSTEDLPLVAATRSRASEIEAHQRRYLLQIAEAEDERRKLQQRIEALEKAQRPQQRHQLEETKHVKHVEQPSFSPRPLHNIPPSSFLSSGTSSSLDHGYLGAPETLGPPKPMDRFHGGGGVQAVPVTTRDQQSHGFRPGEFWDVTAYRTTSEEGPPFARRVVAAVPVIDSTDTDEPPLLPLRHAAQRNLVAPPGIPKAHQGSKSIAAQTMLASVGSITSDSATQTPERSPERPVRKVQERGEQTNDTDDFVPPRRRSNEVGIDRPLFAAFDDVSSPPPVPSTFEPRKQPQLHLASPSWYDTRSPLQHEDTLDPSDMDDLPRPQAKPSPQRSGYFSTTPSRHQHPPQLSQHMVHTPDVPQPVKGGDSEEFASHNLSRQIAVAAAHIHSESPRGRPFEERRRRRRSRSNSPKQHFSPSTETQTLQKHHQSTTADLPINRGEEARRSRRASVTSATTISMKSHRGVAATGRSTRSSSALLQVAANDELCRVGLTLGSRRQQKGYHGVHVVSVKQNSPAESAGIRKNDVIVMWYGVEVDSKEHVTRLNEAHRLAHHHHHSNNALPTERSNSASSHGSSHSQRLHHIPFQIARWEHRSIERENHDADARSGHKSIATAVDDTMLSLSNTDLVPLYYNGAVVLPPGFGAVSKSENRGRHHYMEDRHEAEHAGFLA